MNNTQHSILRNDLTLSTEPYSSFRVYLLLSMSLHPFLCISLRRFLPIGQCVINMFLQTQVSWASLVEIRFGPSRNKVNWIAHATNLIGLGRKYICCLVVKDVLAYYSLV